MFTKITTLAVLAISALSVSAVSYSDVNGVNYSCNSGPVQCCGTIHESGTWTETDLISLVGATVSNVSGQLGVTCSPITGIGAATGANCVSEPVCCEENFQNQLVGVNCVPATVGA
ncbi:hypothetical protein CVT24_005828 [Panaeolus cyanescens]|uniref:Hydrophobin n=1 Tax=Panaeolus cyanescens TaxID=181874 RepID=A0A409VE94_9AGAR|nr:hypothetical protein CVT24_005828 [Panaeolus cyanescens]